MRPSGVVPLVTDRTVASQAPFEAEGELRVAHQNKRRGRRGCRPPTRTIVTTMQARADIERTAPPRMIAPHTLMVPNHHPQLRHLWWFIQSPISPSGRAAVVSSRHQPELRSPDFGFRSRSGPRGAWIPRGLGTGVADREGSEPTSRLIALRNHRTCRTHWGRRSRIPAGTTPPAGPTSRA